MSEIDDDYPDVFDGAAAFDFGSESTERFLEIPNADFTPTDNFACAAWIKIDSTGVQGGLGAQMAGGTNGWTLYHTEHNPPRVKLMFDNNSSAATTLDSNPTTISTTDWVHIGFECIAGAWSLRIDGSEVDSHTGPKTITNSNNLVVGRLYSTTDNFYLSAKMCDFRLWSGLSASLDWSTLAAGDDTGSVSSAQLDHWLWRPTSSGGGGSTQSYIIGG